MDALTLLIVYLVTQNPDFQGNLTPICDKLKQSEDMLKFLGSLSAFPCSPADKPEPPQKPCDSRDPCDRCDPCQPCDTAPPPRPTGSTSTTGSSGSTGTGSYTGARPTGARGTGANANSNANSNAGADNQSQTPLRTLGGEWLEKYITKYLKN